MPPTRSGRMDESLLLEQLGSNLDALQDLINSCVLAQMKGLYIKIQMLLSMFNPTLVNFHERLFHNLL
jgi:hypothetical protein